MEDDRGGNVLDGASLIRAWITHEKYKGHSPKTIKRRLFSATRWELYTLGSFNNRKVQDVEAFLMQWASPATRRALLSDVRALYRFGTARGYVHPDPTIGLELPRQRKRRPSPISSEHVRLLLASTTGERRTMIALAALAGLRVSEIAVLDTHDVDLEHGVLWVRNGKWGKDRAIPISPRLTRELVEYPDGPLFPCMSPDGVSYRIRGDLRRLGISGRPHDLRAAFASELARLSGGNLVLVAELMGHESVQTTQAYVAYSQDASALVARLFAA